MKNYGRVEARLYVFLMSALDLFEWLAIRSGRLSLEERIYIFVGWESQSRSGHSGEEKFLFCRVSSTCPPFCGPARLTDFSIIQ
jgi:hypothetical protein